MAADSLAKKLYPFALSGLVWGWLAHYLFYIPGLHTSPNLLPWWAKIVFLPEYTSYFLQTYWGQLKEILTSRMQPVCPDIAYIQQTPFGFNREIGPCVTLGDTLISILVGTIMGLLVGYLIVNRNRDIAFKR